MVVFTGIPWDLDWVESDPRKNYQLKLWLVTASWAVLADRYRWRDITGPYKWTKKWIDTPLKTNMSPENQWLEDALPTEIVPF